MFYAFKPDWTSDGPLDKCDRKLSTRWQWRLHIIMEKSAEPQLYLNKIEGLNTDYPDWPFALVRLGKAYVLLDDLHGALEQFEKALSLLSPLQDDKFSQYVEGLRSYIMNLETEEDREWSNPRNGVIATPCAPPKDIGRWRFSDASGASTVKSAWENLLSENNMDIISSRYARLSCIEMNEIEKVFALGGESLPRLVKVGFFTGAIDRIGAEGIQEPQKIVAILEDMQECLDCVNQIVKNPSELSEDTIYQIHKIALKSNRIGSFNNGETKMLYVMPPGVYRKRLVYTSLTPGNIVQFTHQSQVPSEMKLFVGMMRKCLEEKDTSPFAMAAWVNAMFGCIHPFTDGNGRVSRLLASVPLIRAGYPFINVRAHKREEYLQALFTAQTTADLQPLMNVFASSMLDSIEYIRSLPPTSPEDEQYSFSADFGIARVYW